MDSVITEEDEARANALTEAARHFVRDYKPDAEPAVIAGHVANWSMEGWEVIARREALGFVPTRSDMLRAWRLIRRGTVEVHIHQLDDPAEVKRLDAMFGKGEWVCCIGCDASPQWCAYHHRKYHDDGRLGE